jgi:hypothetical protein
VRRFSAAFACAAVCACATVPPVPPRPDAGPEVSIRIERVTGDDAWRVSYRLPSPVAEIRFARGGYENRVSHWSVATPGLVLVRQDGEDRIVSAGAPFQELELHIAGYARKPEKDYQVFVPFTDGDVLVYTGVFDLLAPEVGPAWRNVYRLVPRPGDGVVVGGLRQAGEATWVATGDGTYACFGSAEPVETPLGIAVVDRGMPSWLRERTLALAPRVFALYADRTGTRLAVRPTFFLSYGADPDPGTRSFGGGTLDSVVQVDARLGERFRGEGDPAVWESQARLLAHEAAHLWLDHAYEPEEGSSRWLDEGGADAFALRALLELGVISRERFSAILSGDATDCLRRLEQGPLADAGRTGRWKALYLCGELASFLAEAAGSRLAPPQDLLQFWGQVFRGTSGRKYGERLWLTTLSSLPAGTEPAGIVRRMVDGPDAELAADVAAALRTAGVRAIAFGTPPALRIDSWPTR